VSRTASFGWSCPLPWEDEGALVAVTVSVLLTLLLLLLLLLLLSAAGRGSMVKYMVPWSAGGVFGNGGHAAQIFLEMAARDS
jgi:hypothetical protein